MSTHYANLEWAVEERHMNLPALREETEAALRAAIKETEARRALERFVNSFGDGHFQVRWPSPPSEAVTRDQSKSSARPSPCDTLGYRSPARLSAGLAFSMLPEFRSSQSTEFPSGLLDLGGGKRLGIIRMAAFDDRTHPGACERATKALGITVNQECDSQCRDRIEGKAGELLAEDLITEADTLARSGARAILVDITHNGGGSNWVELPPRVLSSVPLEEPRTAFIKHPHWVRQLQDRLRNIEADLNAGREPSEVLRDARERLRRGIAEAEAGCDRSQLWLTGKSDCSLLVKDILYADGLLPYAKPGSFASLESRTSLVHLLRWTYAEGHDRLPLFVAVDRETWSAAENFAAVLQDSQAATIIGELTGGAGCGYTDGGIPTLLKNSGAHVVMPDCARLRKDGSNEVNGVIPDILAPWAERDTPFTKVKKLAERLKVNLSAGGH